MIDILLKAKMMWQITDGLVDPTVGSALIAAGYDQSIEKLSDNIDEVAMTKVFHQSLTDVKIDPTKNQITLPIKTSLDFGGIGKGYLLDKLIPLVETQATDYWLSLGGDLVVSGTEESGQVWSIGVQNPLDHEHDLAKIQPLSGRWAIATSGITKRRGFRHGKKWHHLIDPRTGQPAVTDVLSGMAIAKTGLEADVYAKNVLLLGAEDGIAWAIKQGDFEALAITDKLELISTPGMKPLLKIL
jgi:thiamine biosynthesis lipoprotein